MPNLRKYIVPNHPVVPYPYPSTKRLPSEGAWVVVDAYWRRRLRDGDVREDQEKTSATPKGAKAAAKPKTGAKE